MKIWIPVVVALIGLIGALVTSWPKPLVILQSVLADEECYLLDTTIRGKRYRHTYCFDRSRSDCGIRHKDLGGEFPDIENFQATRCDEDEVSFIGVRSDGYKVEGTFTFVEGKPQYSSMNHPQAVIEVTRVPSPR